VREKFGVTGKLYPRETTLSVNGAVARASCFLLHHNSTAASMIRGRLAGRTDQYQVDEATDIVG